MQVVVVALGKLKEAYWRKAQEEYQKRLSSYMRLEIRELADEPIPDKASAADRQRILQLEAFRVQNVLHDRDGIITLDISGTMLSSEAWSSRYESLQSAGYGRLVFILGGSLGLTDELLKRAAFRWSFGAITLPHQLARIVLLEQLYRGIKIAKGEPYHK